jgi:hypothetical protein
MKPLLALMAVGTLVLPGLASDPSRVRATKAARPESQREFRGQAFAAAPPLPAPESLPSRFAKAGCWPDRFVAELLAEPLAREYRWRKGRAEFHRWMVD